MNFKERTLTGIKSLIAELKQMIVNGVTPARTISWFYRDTAPTGWDICDGRIVTMNDGTSLETPNLIGRYPLGATSAIGTIVEAGLPNITGKITSIDETVVGNGNADIREPLTWADQFDVEGALSIKDLFNAQSYRYSTAMDAANAGYKTIEFDASESNSIYGNSNTVTPPSVRLLPCIKL